MTIYCCYLKIPIEYKHVLTDPIEQNLPAKEEMRDFDSVIVNFMREQGIPGASLCIAKGGHVIYTQSKFYPHCRKCIQITVRPT